MKASIPLSSFKRVNVEEHDGGTFTFPINGGGALTITSDKGSPFGCELSRSDFIVCDLRNNADFACALYWEFAQDDGRSIGFKMGLMPHLLTRIAIPASALDGNTLFLRRTPGKLKTVTQGRPIDPARLARFSISIPHAPADVNLTVACDPCVCDSEPDYPVEAKPMVDPLGQKACTDWKGKTHSEDELKAFLHAELEKKAEPPAGRSKYGGMLDKKLGAGSGFFAVEHDGRRFWLRDPDGYAFFSIGLDCVSTDGVCNLNGIESLTSELPKHGAAGWFGEHEFSWQDANLHRAFGDGYYEAWAKLTRRRLDEWGFNTIACWSDSEYIKRDARPFTFIFGGYPHTKQMLFRDFPDVFSEEFAVSSKAYAAQIAPLANNPHLIGYFLSNEPGWAFVNNNNLAAMLLGDKRPLASKAALIAFVSERYEGDIDALNAAWDSVYTDFESLNSPRDAEKLSETALSDLLDFSAEMVREYIRVPSEAIKEIDPNHLNLGIRYAWLSSKILIAGSEYFDVFSFNCYSNDPRPAIEATLKTIREGSDREIEDDTLSALGKPVMIGEYHFGALDRGLDATGIRGVTSQTERGVAYRYYMEGAASHPNCLGAHYFTLNDQGYLGRFDGENYQIGLVDVCNKPYYEFTDEITAVNAAIYEVADGKRQPSEQKANEITALFF